MNAVLKRGLFAFAVGFVVALAPSCGTNGNSGNKCDATSCPTGCCDAAGTCQLGTQATNCGTGGAACAVCTAQQSCVSNACTANQGGGGGAGGGAGGGSGGGAGGGSGGGGGGTGGGTGGGGGVDNSITGDAGVSAFMAACASGKTALCQYLARCGFASTTAALCEEAIDRGDIYYSACTDLLLQASIKEGRVGVDTAVLSSCTAALATAPCDRNILGENAHFDTVCKNALRPKQSVGAACTLHGRWECINGVCDTENGLTCPSTCAPLAQLGADAGEDGTFNRCADGLYPYDEEGTGFYKCQAPVAQGGSCAPSVANGFENKACATGSWCDYLNTENCLPHRGADAGCEMDEECAPSLMCNRGFCRPTLPGTNTSCSDTSVYTCRVGLYCYLDNNVCNPPAAAGAVCDPFNFDADCRYSTFCEEQTDGGANCAAKRTTGGACPNASECASGYFCDSVSDTCKPTGGVDAGCDFDDECQPGLACNNGTSCGAPISCP